MRGFDSEFQKQVDEFHKNPPKDHQQNTEREDRHDLAEKQETRKDTNT